MAKHRAHTQSAQRPRVFAVSMLSAGLIGGVSSPAFALTAATAHVPEISIDIPHLNEHLPLQGDAAPTSGSKDSAQQDRSTEEAARAAAKKTAQSAASTTSDKALPIAREFSRTVKPTTRKIRNSEAGQRIREGLAPVKKELAPVKKAVQPAIDSLATYDSVATVVDAIVPLDELVTPAAQESPAAKRAEARRARGSKILKAARTRIGQPYVWGATGPNAFDCSGLVLWAHEQLGIKIPRSSQDQVRGGRHIARKDLQPGDIVAFYGNASHVGVYAGHNRVVHAPYQGRTVAEDSLDSMPYYGATRYY